MVHKIMSKYGSQLAALALFVRTASPFIPCRGTLYQPKVPDKLLRK